MLSQCANPTCARPLTSLSEGRLFQFEIVSISVSATDDTNEDFDETPRRETAHFWLCPQCAATMALTLEPWWRHIEGIAKSGRFPGVESRQNLRIGRAHV